MNRVSHALLALTCLTAFATAGEELTPKIAWYGTLESGLAEAKRTNRPILFVSAAPHCLGVPGEW